MTKEDLETNLEQKSYRMHEGELSIPASWQDQSMQMFRISTASSGNDASFIVTRDYQGASLEPLIYAEAQHEALKHKFAEFHLLALAQISIKGLGAAVIEYEWAAKDVTLRQRQAYVPTRECMLVLTLTAIAQEFEQHIRAWNSALQSLRLTSTTLRDEALR